MTQDSPGPAPVRIAPLAAGELDTAQRELIDSAMSGPAPATNLYLTLVRHPGLTRRWLPFSGKLLAGKLPGRDRELLILRTGWHCQSPYEWGQHVVLGGAAGLSGDEIERIKQGPEAPGWAPLDALLLDAADQLHHTARIGDQTWTALAGHYDERQLIEIPMVVGHYHLVSYVLNSLGVVPEEGVPPMQ